jgi:predicted transposase/invertase (TIGR01784 family)
VYLEDLLDKETSSLGIAIVQLILAPEAKALELAKRLAVQVERETTLLLQDEMLEFIETILVYKFPQLSRQEIEAMFTLDELKHTRVYQEAKQEGKQEGRQEGVRQVAINLLNAGMAVSQVAKLTDLSIEEVQQLQVDSENDA